MTLEQDFEKRVYQDLHVYIREIGYPHEFIKMLERYGAVGTARRLFAEGEATATPRHSGFTKAWDAGRLDLTIEWLPWAEPRWRPLFPEFMPYLMRLGIALRFPQSRS